jgi:hypothetical protein
MVQIYSIFSPPCWSEIPGLFPSNGSAERAVLFKQNLQRVLKHKLHSHTPRTSFPRLHYHERSNYSPEGGKKRGVSNCDVLQISADPSQKRKWNFTRKWISAISMGIIRSSYLSISAVPMLFQSGGAPRRHDDQWRTKWYNWVPTSSFELETMSVTENMSCYNMVSTC